MDSRLFLGTAVFFSSFFGVLWASGNLSPSPSPAKTQQLPPNSMWATAEGRVEGLGGAGAGGGGTFTLAYFWMCHLI